MPTACRLAWSRLLQARGPQLSQSPRQSLVCRHGSQSPAGQVPRRKENESMCVSPLSGPPKISALLETCELEIHISVTGQERATAVESWGMKWHPRPSLGAACTTREQLPPKSTLGLSGPWDSPTTHRQQALYNLWRRMGEREGGTSQCPRAGTQPEGQH